MSETASIEKAARARKLRSRPPAPAPVTFPQRLSEGQAAQFLFGGDDASVHTLRYWRAAGRGPTYHKVGVRVLYNLTDLEAFVQAGRVEPRRA
ncbi:helix-turn-helix domain-containing protein [Lysobacter sp. S4-A87]|uniref:helix-turn-helix domain-containing protein n=1 Tax=Lysobacter sp. S4-A87 TaxID=2925843 RepID=UPI001F52BE15|nr:helix-turn-helix domain-containing protein [Lysobacter sp. S4-A87]UNK50555.1 helix-turn-helix domain-containing protein [Lysobacter sp. S4-A87]